MKKTYILTFSITLVVLITIMIVALMILLPQQSTVVDASASNYESIKKSDYLYEQTKDITKDALVREYTITNEEIEKFKGNHQYVSGNSDPFTPKSVENSGTNNHTNNSTNGNSNSSSSSTNNQSSTSEDTNQKVTNSNGGQPNPPSTAK